MLDNISTTIDQTAQPATGQQEDNQLEGIRRRKFLGAVGASTVLGVGLSSPATGQEQPVVEVGNTYFDPIGLSVELGTTVRFKLAAGTHSVTAYENRIPADTSPFDSGTLSEGVFEHTFDEAGTYDYYCRPHQSTQVGRIVVGEPGGPAEEAPIPDGAVPDSEAIVDRGSIGIDSFNDATSGTRGRGSHDCSHGGMMDFRSSEWSWIVPTGVLATVLGATGVAFALAGRQQGDAGKDEAMEILRERYRREEIDSEEFERRRKRIRRED